MGLAEKRVGTIIDEDGDTHPIFGRGNQPQIGDPAPSFSLWGVNPRTNDIEPFRSTSLFPNKVVLLHTTYAAFDKTSHTVTRSIQELRRKAATVRGILEIAIPLTQLEVITVTEDLIPSQAEWIKALKLNPSVAHAVASSAHTLGEFASQWGVTRKDPSRGLAEGIWVIDNGIIMGRWLQTDLTKPASYKPAMDLAVSLVMAAADTADAKDTVAGVEKFFFQKP